MTPEHQRHYQALLLAKERTRTKLFHLIDCYGASDPKVRALERRYHLIQADTFDLERGTYPGTR